MIHGLNFGKVFSYAIIVLFELAAGGYLYAGNIRQALYFFLAGLITLVVTYGV